LPDTAYLVEVAGATLPEGASVEWFSGAGGARLRAALFPPSGVARGSVVVSPGRTEPIEKYVEAARRLALRGFVVLVHDWRGQGLSDRFLKNRLLGHAAGHETFLADYDALVSAFASRLPEPWIALGHSMGGCLTLLALARGETRFSGAILSAPMLGLRIGALPPPVARGLAAALTTLGAGRLAVPVAATLPAFEANILTHDRARYARGLAQIQACPDLALGPPTWAWLDFALKATHILATGPGVPRVTLPVTVVAAGDERLVDNAAVEAVTARLPAGRYLEAPGAYHEILQETDEIQAVFWRAFDALVARVRGPA
jgi:lysophospholipase